MTPEEEAEYREYLAWKQHHEQRKQKFRDDGIPVGYGIPEDGELQEKEAEAREELAQSEFEDDVNTQMMMNEMMQPSTYTPPYAPNDKAKIIDFINTQIPIKYKYSKTEDGKLVREVEEGEIPPEVMFQGGLFAYYNHTATMSNLDDREIREHHSNLRILRMSAEMSMPRKNYTPEMMSKMDGAEFQLQLRVNQNKMGQERYLSAAEIHEENKRFGMGNRSSKLRNVWGAIKGE